MILAETRLFSYRPSAVIRVTGEDAFTFLQGQFTNELRQPCGSATYGLWLDQKGKVLADSHVLGVSEKEFLVVSVGSAADVIRQRLEAYIVADDVALADETAQAHGLLLGGPRSGEMIEQVLGARPAGKRFVTDEKGASAFAGRRLPGESFEIIGPAAALSEIRSRLHAAGAKDGEAGGLDFARITAGIPAIPADAGPGDLPNEAHLEDAAISYTKGCYLGQEVMARLKNLGQVRRRLHVVRGQGAPPPPRSALYQGEKKVGEIRSAATQGSDFVALAMLSLINFEPDAGLALEPTGPAAIHAESHG